MTTAEPTDVQGRRSRGSQRRFIASWVALLVVAGCVWWAVHPPRDAEAYHDEATRTVEALRSQVETTLLWVEAVRDDRVTRAAASVALTETSTDADTHASSWSAHDPADRESERVWRRVSAPAEEVAATLAEVRVAAHAGRWDEVVASTPHLERLARELARLQREVSR